MANERKTDFFIGNLLHSINVEFTPNGSDIKEVEDALRSASKKGSGHAGFPEFTGKSQGFLLVVEDKEDTSKQAKYSDEAATMLSSDPKSTASYAENGALHYAQHIIKMTTYKKIFAFGCSGNEKHHRIRPIFVDENGYKLLHEVDNFENFSPDNIDKYFHEQVCGETPEDMVELEQILQKSAGLHEALRNYGQLGDSEKPLVVSAIILALRERSFSIDTLDGDLIETDGQKIFNALTSHLARVEVQPQTKKDQILNQFTIIKDRVKLNQIDTRLGKTPLKYFAEFIKKHILAAVVTNSPEDVLGRFYGEFIRYSGGDGQTLGVVLTPRHITELFCELLDVKPSDKVFDPCCGTGGFLIAAMNRMLELALPSERERIKREQIHGIEVRDDMFAIATTNMILRGDGKSNLVCDDFLLQQPEKIKSNCFTLGLMNPPYSQAKNKDTAHLSELSFVKHLLDCLGFEGRCAVIVPQSAMIGKTKEDCRKKKEILKKHTLEGVITLSKDTFYRVGTNPCIAIFKAHTPHPKDKYCKFINFDDDGYVINKHIGLVATERAKERIAHLLDCWRYDAPAESKFIVKNKVEPDDEWLHSFYYYNDEIPNENEFLTTMADYLTFEYQMISHGREYIFEREEKENDAT